MAKRIAILGTVHATRLMAPFGDPEWEIWVCAPGNAYGAIPKIDRWFELHGLVDMKNPNNAGWSKPYFEWLVKQPFPVYMQEPNELLPQARVFPIKRWLKELGHRGRINATSSIALMVGFAIMEGAEEIGIWGVDMADVTEAYSNQKSGCQNLLCMAAERGIKVTIPLESCLGTNPPLYGYAEASRVGMRMYIQEEMAKAKVNECQLAANNAERILHMSQGALEQIQWFRRTFVDGALDAELDVDETQLDLGGGTTADVVHSKGTTIEGFPVSDHRPVSRIPEVGDDIGAFEMGPGGIFVRKPGNSGAHPEE